MTIPAIAPSLSSGLDLPLAWRRVQADLAERRAFVRHPFHEQLIDPDLSAWLGNLSVLVDTDTYVPSPCGLCSVPKPQGHVRPGGVLTLEDQVLYSALVQQLRAQIQPALQPAAGSPDYSYQLRSKVEHLEWFEQFFPRWKAFDADSINHIDAGATHVVVADIAGYYEQIDLYSLRSDLNGLGVDSKVLALLMTMLHRWTRIERRGLPQGYSPSDLLGKLYLNSVDLTLKNEGLQHIRWVDDFRIFCRSEAEARQALIVLIGSLGRRGLVVQSAKTRVLPASAAREKFDELASLLQPIQDKLKRQFLEAGVAGGAYFAPKELDAALAAMAATNGPISTVRDAYTQYFTDPAQPFRKTLFRYLVKRMGAARDGTHRDSILATLRDHPEEFDSIAGYATALKCESSLEERYLAWRKAGLFPYEYLLYQVLRWRLRQDDITSDLLDLARQCAFRDVAARYVRAVARSAIGKWGNPADLEQLEHIYPATSSDLEKTEIICALSRMEIGRRNGFLGRAAGDGTLCSRAARLVRGGGVSWSGC